MMGDEIQSEKDPLKPNTKKIINRWALDFALNLLIKFRNNFLFYLTLVF